MTIDIKHAFNPCEWRRDLLSGPDGIFVPESSQSTSATKEPHTRRTWREQRPKTFKDPVGGASMFLAGKLEAAASHWTPASRAGSEADANEVV